MAAGRLVLFSLLAISLASAALAQARGNEPPRRGGDDRAPPRRPEVDLLVDAGYVFIDRQYLAPPYKLSDRDGNLSINGVVVTRQRDKRAEPWPGSRGPDDGFRGERRPPPGPGWSRPGPGGFPGDRGARWLEGVLKLDGVVFAFREQPIVVADSGASVDLLKSLVGSDDAEALESFLATLPPQESQQEWKDWITGYSMPDSLRTRAVEVVEKSEEMSRKNEAAAAAVQRLHRFAYPLNVLGMVAGVLAVGHLLRSLPKKAHEPTGEQSLREHQRAAMLSAGLVALFSALDLVWTILAWQAGQMSELNPLGSRLIEDPLSLAMFKTGTTLVSCGLLVALRRHAQAQFAAWWLCLLCTILTFRWLVVNSLFVAL